MPKSSMTPVRSFSPAVEDYLKAIYRLQGEAGDPVTTNALGDWLGVTAPSASGMLKKLDDLRLVAYVPYRGVRLSEAGRRAALGGGRRDRILEAFLAETLGLSWDKVHDEAEALEHALSPGLCEVIAARLGDPQTDPHGDPIPTRDGQVAETPSLNLGSLRPGQRGRVVRVSDREPGALRDGLHLPGDVHARGRRHPPWLWRAGPAALRTGLGLVRRRRSHPDQPGHPRSRVRLHPCRAGLLPSRLRCGRRARAGAGCIHPQRRALLALGAHRARPGPLQRPVPARGDPSQTPRGSRRELS